MVAVGSQNWSFIFKTRVTLQSDFATYYTTTASHLDCLASKKLAAAGSVCSWTWNLTPKKLLPPCDYSQACCSGTSRVEEDSLSTYPRQTDSLSAVFAAAGGHCSSCSCVQILAQHPSMRCWIERRQSYVLLAITSLFRLAPSFLWPIHLHSCCLLCSKT
jgi:hypothetical protein